MSVDRRLFVVYKGLLTSVLIAIQSLASPHRSLIYVELSSLNMIPCIRDLMQYSGSPPVSVAYSPPENCSWTHVALQFNASSKGEQYDRIAAVWLGGAELLRTSTAEPTDEGIFWTVTKDVTRYSSILVNQNISLSVMLENLVNDIYTGVYKRVIIPKNAYKAVIEIYVSAHGYDEFWYSNPPDSYIQMNNLTTRRGHGAYREVLVNIDENLVGSVVPFPVIFTGGINPLYWEPLVSIGAFDLPSYDIDLLTIFRGFYSTANPIS
ncbi:hypothetical protein HAX54_026281 [Datura stramonium]|uniref:Peptide N-acetyl-beta-D-glucosaminyl asparaginase amidase A N-terminal domain-containing protein n=1 Tax=Datura stramonium TaxID=4076 RepID=A0ABS8V0V8_DATST|nr:hypothetical protein [Datura stramonium]